MDTVDAVDSGVVSFKKSNRITVPTHIDGGFCLNRQHGSNTNCLTVNPPNACDACFAVASAPPLLDASSVRVDAMCWRSAPNFLLIEGIRLPLIVC